MKSIDRHKNLQNIMKYVHWEKVIFQRDRSKQEFHTAVAKNLEEFEDYLSKGFDYISDWGEWKVLRKRK